MKVYFAADHAGFELKKTLLSFVRVEMGLDVEDCGASEYDVQDDYPAIIASAARKLSADALGGIDSRAILIGGSGQGEAIVANRFKGVRAAVFYGNALHPQEDADGRLLDILMSTRTHNDANALAIGARFITVKEAAESARAWLAQDFSHDERHARRIAQIDTLA